MRDSGSCRRGAISATALWLALALASANASEIKQLRVETGATGTRAELLLDVPGPYQLIRLSNPERLVLDFPDGHLARGLTLPGGAGVVSSVRTGQPVPGTVRVVFDLTRPVAAIPTRLDSDPAGMRLVLEWPEDAAPARPAATQRPPTGAPAASPAPTTAAVAASAAPASATNARPATPIATVPPSATPTPAAVPPVAPAADPAPAPAPAPAPTSASAPTPALPPPPSLLAMRAGLRPLVVAIDAGHGGQDPGARGLNGTREKDVTLAIARELARQVNATPGLKAYLTRDSDVFIPLPYRARRASEHNADIFISIHADAAENRSARGSSIYILSTRGASSQRARWLADTENAADIIGGDRVRTAGDTLTTVLLDLTQSGNMKASEDAASHILDGLKRVGNSHKAEVERANFAVLRTSDKMPAMLVETAFISNPEEERELADPAFQRTLAQAILGGIDAYFTRQPPPGTLYAARAQAAQSARLDPPPRSGIGGER